MLILNDQKKRLETMLNEYNNIQWQENKSERYRVIKSKSIRGSLWLRITKGNETIAISTTGEITTNLENFIIKNIGQPRNNDGNHREWFNVNFSNAKIIVAYLNSQ